MKSKAKKLAKMFGWKYGEMNDNSCCYVGTQNDTHCVEFTFDPTGNVLIDVAIYERVFEEQPSERVAMIGLSPNPSEVSKDSEVSSDYARYF